MANISLRCLLPQQELDKLYLVVCALEHNRNRIHNLNQIVERAGSHRAAGSLAILKSRIVLGRVSLIFLPLIHGSTIPQRRRYHVEWGSSER